MLSKQGPGEAGSVGFVTVRKMYLRDIEAIRVPSQHGRSFVTERAQAPMMTCNGVLAMVSYLLKFPLWPALLMLGVLPEAVQHVEVSSNPSAHMISV